MTKANELAKKLEDDRVQALGWLITAIHVFSATIVSSLLYGCGSWVNLTKTQCEIIESTQRQCLTTVLGITGRCSYQTLLHVTGLMPALDIVKKTKVSFVNDLFHIKGKGICKEVLEKEYLNTESGGLLREVQEICKEIGIDDVTKTYVRPDHIKEKIHSFSRIRVLIDSLGAKSAPFHHINPKPRDYLTDSKERAKLALCYDVGCLNFRGHRKRESIKKYGSYQCHVPGCTGDDTLHHVVYECQGYSIKLKDNGISKECIDSLFELNKVRKARFRTSMINWST